MGYDFPKQQYFIQVEATDELTTLGKYEFQDVTELSQIELNIQKVGIHTTEEIRLEIHGSETEDLPLALSDWYSYDDFAIGSSHWVGKIVFDFDRYHINPNQEYWLKVQVTNYVYTDDARYIAFALDWPLSINDYAVDNETGAMAGIVGYVEI